MSIFLTLYLGDKLQKRIFACILAYIAAIAGLLVLWLLPLSNSLGRLFGTYLCVRPCSTVLLVKGLYLLHTLATEFSSFHVESHL